MSLDGFFQNLEVNPTDDRQRDVSHGYSAWSATPQCAEMSVTVDDEIRRSPIEDDSQLAVAEHPVLGERLSTERGCGGSEVKRRDAHVRVERQQGALERFTLAAGSEGKALQGPRMDRRWPFVRPETAATAGRASDTDARSVRQPHQRGATVQHLDATAFERAPERDSAQRSQVVITEHRYHGQSSSR
jgi:hypothetical protein